MTIKKDSGNYKKSSADKENAKYHKIVKSHGLATVVTRNVKNQERDEKKLEESKATKKARAKQSVITWD